MMTTSHSVSTALAAHPKENKKAPNDDDGIHNCRPEPKSLGSDTTTTDPQQTGQLFRVATDDGKLSSEDFIELTRISRKKNDIEKYITQLQGWPAWDPFQQVSAYSADLEVLARNKAKLESIDGELRGRQARCQLLENDVQQFNLEDMKRLRTVAKAISKRHLSGPDTDLLELALETVYALDKLLRLLRERRAEHDLTELRLRWETTICSSWEDVLSISRDIEAFEQKCKTVISSLLDTGATLTSTYSSAADTHPNKDRTASKKRTASLTTSSATLAGESLKLESSRLVLRIKSFDTEKVRPAGRLLDLLIDQRQVPEKMIDEQEKLEDALPQPSVLEASSSQLVSSLKRAEASAREITDTLNTEGAQPSNEVHSPTALEKCGSSSSIGSNASRVTSMPFAARKPSKSISAGSRSRTASTSSLRATPHRSASNRYRPNPRDALDVAVGNIVNHMSMAIAIRPATLSDTFKSQRSSTMPDLSGQYWIGEPEPRLCFCRILPSNTVMVRVGGGWQELSGFLNQHYAHLSAQDLVTNPGTSLASPGNSGSTVTWFRSASGPAGSSRLRSVSSFGSLSSCDHMRLSSPPNASRIVTMPTKSTSIAVAQEEPLSNIPQTKTLAAADQHQMSSCSSSRSFGLSSSESGSSIVIHAESPS